MLHYALIVIAVVNGRTYAEIPMYVLDFPSEALCQKEAHDKYPTKSQAGAFTKAQCVPLFLKGMDTK